MPLRSIKAQPYGCLKGSLLSHCYGTQHILCVGWEATSMILLLNPLILLYLSSPCCLSRRIYSCDDFLQLRVLVQIFVVAICIRTRSKYADFQPQHGHHHVVAVFITLATTTEMLAADVNRVFGALRPQPYILNPDGKTNKRAACSCFVRLPPSKH